MNRLPVEKRAEILELLCRGASLRGVNRVTGVSLNTITKLIVDAGEACRGLHDRVMCGVRAKEIVCIKVWSPIGVSAGLRSPPSDVGADGVWTWSAVDLQSDLIVSYVVGHRDAPHAARLLADLAARLHPEAGLSARPDPRTLADDDGPTMLPTRLSEQGHAAHSTGASLGPVSARMSERRFTRLRNAYSKKGENFENMVHIYVAWSNFVRRRTKPSRAETAGVCRRSWSMQDLAQLADDLR